MSTNIIHGALDEFGPDDNSKTIVIRGVIDPLSLNEIKAADYQREIVSASKISALAKAIRDGRVPDVELGMRGDRVREDTKTNQFKLLDDVFVIDGLQRLTAARHLMQTHPDAVLKVRIGATVHLNTTYDWERERFRILNQERTKIAPNVLLRNMCPDVPGIAMLRSICLNDASFVLKDRVTWTQNMIRSDIISALTLCRVTGVLHRRFTNAQCQHVRDVDKWIGKTIDKAGKISVRENIKEFFAFIDECYGIKRIAYVKSAPYVKSGFLTMMADLFTRHEDFWKESKLFIPRELRMKISKFAINDGEVIRLVGASGKAQFILYQMMLEHINSGKRTKRLTPTPGMAMEPDDEEEPENSLATTGVPA